MSYPRSLLPKKYFRTFNVDELPNSKNYYLVRRSSCPSTEAFDRLGLLTSKALLGLNSSTKMPDIKQVYGMSMNFLGMFKTRHLIYVAKNNAKKYWTSKTNHQWTYQNDIEVDSHTSPIYFKLFDLHEFQFPYFRQIDKDYKKRIPDKLSAGLSPSSIHACSKVLHKPIMANFWHSEFHVEDLLTGRIFKPSDTSSGEIGLPQQHSQKIGSQVANLAIQNILIGKAKMRIERPIKIPLKVYNLLVYKLDLWFRTIFFRNSIKNK